MGSVWVLTWPQITRRGSPESCALQPGEGLTALRFSDSGLQCAVGMQNGLVALYDLRSSRPLIVKDHNYGTPIKDIKFHTSDSMAGMQLAN